MLIRAEEQGDWLGVHAVVTAAFETPAEARLVAVLRRQAHPIVSLVAVEDGALVGHIMFSRATLSERSDLKIMGLAPMAVTPGRQLRGIGSALVVSGLERCRRLGAGAVVVLGHPEYYSRFGFVPAVRFGIDSEYDAPEEAFMALELQPGFLDGTSGVIRYHSAFAGL